jgi:hypothetical protein
MYPKEYQKAASKFSSMETDKHSYLLRARDCSRLTLPTLIPDQGWTSATKFPVPFQGIGARGVNHLAASLLLSLLPPNQPFFRLVLDEEALRELDAVDIKAEIDKTLGSIERSVMQEIEVMAIRPVVFEALKHLIVGGNALLHLGEDGLRTFGLEHYCIRRDPAGTIRDIVVRESVAARTLPQEFIDAVGPEKYHLIKDSEAPVDLYTCIHLTEKDKYEAYQEIEGVILESTRGSYTKKTLPWFALRMNRVDGESYGRGYVEEYLGDLKSLEGLTQAIVEGSAAAAKVTLLVNPNGMTSVESLSRSPNGAIIEGISTDVTVLQIPKQADFAIAFQTISAITERLSYAFLLAESTIRNAERVTAEEVRLTTAAVERQLGGIYSILSQEFQLPLVRRLMSRMEKEKRLPRVPDKYVHPMVVTGIDALGRGNDLAKLDAFIQGLLAVGGAEGMAWINMGEFLTRRAAALGIDTEGLIRSPEEVQQEQQQAQMMALANKAGPALVNQVGQGARENPETGAALASAMQGNVG